MPEQILGSINRSNPGRFRCHAVFDDEVELAFCGQEREAIGRFGAEHGFADFEIVSVDPYSGEWMRGENIGRLARF